MFENGFDNLHGNYGDEQEPEESAEAAAEAQAAPYGQWETVEAP